MKKETIIYTVLIIIIAGLAALYIFQPRVVTVTETVAQIDTMYFQVEVAGPPDTVYVTRWRQARPDTVIIVQRDTAQQDAQGATLTLDTPQWYLSEKKFASAFVQGRVQAFAAAPVDSFFIETHLQRDQFAKFYAQNMRAADDHSLDWLTYGWVGLGAGILLGMMTLHR